MLTPQSAVPTAFTRREDAVTRRLIADGSGPVASSTLCITVPAYLPRRSQLTTTSRTVVLQPSQDLAWVLSTFCPFTTR